MVLSLSAFWPAFLAAVNLHYPELADPALQPKDTPQSILAQEYDFIIVGAGTAGSIVANRLTEVPEWKVLLIEAGGDEDAISSTPRLALHSWDTDKDWNYTTVKQKKACLSKGGYCNVPRGRVMGGSSSINCMMYVRGGRPDYDEWERLGMKGWGYDDVLPYFIKAENYKVPSLLKSPLYGTKGPLSVQHSLYKSSILEDLLHASISANFSFKDHNGMQQENVVDYAQYTIDGSTRHSTSRAYLNPIRNRQNLHVIKRSIVKKIIMDGKTAKGVEYVRNGKIYKILANKEVILSAGAIDTPKLLMLSGIGPKKELEKLDINVIKDLPVGEHLKDHALVSIYFKLDDVKTFTPSIWSTEESIMEYVKDKRGPLSSFIAEVISTFNPLDNNGPPTAQLLYLTGHGDFHCLDDKNILWALVGLLHPESEGTVKLRSNNYMDPPLVDPNYFHKEIDSIIIRKGIKKVFDVMKMSPMSKHSPKLLTDCHQPLCAGLSEEEYIQCVVLQYSSTYHHLVGTAGMGFVVSNELLVKGVKNLRVIDASVMPDIPRANTNGPTIMVAEKGVDLVKRHHLVSEVPKGPLTVVTIGLVILIYIYFNKFQ